MKNKRCFFSSNRTSSHQHPLAPTLDKFVQQDGQVRQNEATDVESKELGGVTRAKFQPDLSLVRMPQARVFDLACDLIYVCVEN